VLQCWLLTRPCCLFTPCSLPQQGTSSYGASATTSSTATMPACPGTTLIASRPWAPALRPELLPQLAALLLGGYRGSFSTRSSRHSQRAWQLRSSCWQWQGQGCIGHPPVWRLRAAEAGGSSWAAAAGLRLQPVLPGLWAAGLLQPVQAVSCCDWGTGGRTAAVAGVQLLRKAGRFLDCGLGCMAQQLQQQQ